MYVYPIINLVFNQTYPLQSIQSSIAYQATEHGTDTEMKVVTPLNIIYIISRYRSQSRKKNLVNFHRKNWVTYNIIFEISSSCKLNFFYVFCYWCCYWPKTLLKSRFPLHSPIIEFNMTTAICRTRPPIGLTNENLFVISNYSQLLVMKKWDY